MNKTIINGIDVSECALFKDRKCRNLTHLIQGEYSNCNSMCDYGAYARKEQLKRLQEENEELKEKIKDLESITGIFSVRLMEKYKQALEEIRNEIGDLKDINKLINLQKILDKINEVLNGRD